MNIKIRFARNSDIDQILLLNKKWLVANIDEADKTNGFLFGDSLTKLDLEKIVEAREITVAHINELIVGYYLFDNYSDTQVLKQYSCYINDLIFKGFIKKQYRVSKRAQAVIEKEFQNRGLSKLLFELLLTEAKNNYDILFSVVSKENPKIIAHQKAGWSIVDETESLYFVIYNFNS